MAAPMKTLASRLFALLGGPARGLLPVEVVSDELPGGLRLSGMASPPDQHLASSRGSLTVSDRRALERLAAEG